MRALVMAVEGMARDGIPRADSSAELVGERVYIRDYHGVKIESTRAMLHAQALGFVHPRTDKRILFKREAPADFQAMLERLRSDAGLM